MTGVERCECCDLPVQSCGKAAERRIAEQRKSQATRAMVTTPGARPAMFHGLCTGCGEPIRKGDPIAVRGGRWVGLLCCAD